jgi:pantoate--beta-alanine ligase
MQLLNTTAQLLQIRKQLGNKKVAFVPTMGNLHPGHTTLFDLAKQHSDIVISSIFVNPKQFGAGEDFASYPRTLEQDLAILKKHEVDYLFAPASNEIYPDNDTTTINIDIPSLTSLWCGQSRPGYFQGILTIVNMLFNLVRPDIGVFGNKDFQQALLIKRMVADLHMPMRILTAATARESDGLAYSSRNQYLTTHERDIANQLYGSLVQIAEQLTSDTDYRQLEQAASIKLQQMEFKVDYISICYQHDLHLANDNKHKLIILAAAYLGKARLIDNLLID